MGEEYFDYNAHNVWHILQLFGLQSIPFISIYINELNLVSSVFDHFVQEIV